MFVLSNLRELPRLPGHLSFPRLPIIIRPNETATHPPWTITLADPGRSSRTRCALKDRELNNLPIWYSSVVPLRQEFVKHNSHGFLEVVRDFLPSFVCFVEDLNSDL